MDAAHPGTRFRVRRLDETGSTNADGVAAAAAGEPEGLVIVANHQTAGRGRLGRTWSAAPGSALLMSVLLRPPAEASHLAVAAVACAASAACGETAGVEPGVKWPNDLVVGGRKLGGILAEATSSGNVTAVVVGLGLNLRLAPDFPAELREIATALDGLTDHVPTRDELLDGILRQLEPRYRGLRDVGPGDLLAEYRARCVTIGSRVRVAQEDGSWEGEAVGIDERAALLVLRDGIGVVTVDVGDVVHLRPA